MNAFSLNLDAFNPECYAGSYDYTDKFYITMSMPIIMSHTRIPTNKIPSTPAARFPASDRELACSIVEAYMRLKFCKPEVWRAQTAALSNSAATVRLR
eukprot:187932-Pyramimonas_sp.AAC.1